jgi:hypothetical protein
MSYPITSLETLAIQLNDTEGDVDVPLTPEPLRLTVNGPLEALLAIEIEPDAFPVADGTNPAVITAVPPAAISIGNTPSLRENS